MKKIKSCDRPNRQGRESPSTVYELLCTNKLPDLFGAIFGSERPQGAVQPQIIAVRTTA